MHQSLILTVATLALAQATLGQTAVQENPLARAALDVFATKCVQCHGTEVPHPKAAFGYVNDLKRLVASGKYVVPGQPDKSELWKEIEEGDMPPDEARAGPITPAEKNSILQWIAGGAPQLASEGGPIARPAEATEVQAASPSVPKVSEVPLSKRDDRGMTSRLVVLLGRFHVVVIHFPIALLMVAALAEAWEMLRRSSIVPSSLRVCIVLGAIASFVAVGLGWIHALDGFAGPLSSPSSITGLHRWIGTAVGVIAPVVAWLSERDARRGKRSNGVRWGIFALAAIAGAAGHFGGLLTHGSGYFTP